MEAVPSMRLHRHMLLTRIVPATSNLNRWTHTCFGRPRYISRFHFQTTLVFGSIIRRFDILHVIGSLDLPVRYTLQVSMTTLDKTLIPLPAFHRKCQATDEITKFTPSQGIPTTCLQWQHPVVDDNPHQLLIMAMAFHLLEICSGSKGDGPACGIPVSLCSGLQGSLGEKWGAIVQSHGAEDASHITSDCQPSLLESCEQSVSKLTYHAKNLRTKRDCHQWENSLESRPRYCSY